MAASTISQRLMALRKRAGLSVRKLSEEIGRSHSTYYMYERNYKKAYIPMDWVELLIPRFVGRGSPPITKEEVLALGTIPNAPWIKSHDNAVEGSAPKALDDAPALSETQEASEVVNGVAKVPLTQMGLRRDEVRLIYLWRGLDEEDTEFFLGLIRDAIAARRSA